MACKSLTNAVQSTTAYKENRIVELMDFKEAKLPKNLSNFYHTIVFDTALRA